MDYLFCGFWAGLCGPGNALHSVIVNQDHQSLLYKTHQNSSVWETETVPNVSAWADVCRGKGSKMWNEWLIASSRCERSLSATWKLKVQNITGNTSRIRLACSVSQDLKLTRYMHSRYTVNIVWFSVCCMQLSASSVLQYILIFYCLIGSRCEWVRCLRKGTALQAKLYQIKAKAKPKTKACKKLSIWCS